MVVLLLDIQGVNPLLDGIYPRIHGALAARGLDPYRADLYTVLFDALAEVLAMVVSAEAVRRLYGLKPSEMGWTRMTRWPLRVLVGAAVGLLLVPLWGVSKNLSGELFFHRLPYIRFGTAPGWRTLGGPADLLNLFGNWIFSAPAEEILFRGAVYGALKRRFDRRAAMPLSALLFAWAHFPWSGAGAFDPFYFGWLVFSGLAFAVLLEWDGSLLTPIVAHSVLDVVFLSIGVSFLMT